MKKKNYDAVTAERIRQFAQQTFGVEKSSTLYYLKKNNLQLTFMKIPEIHPIDKISFYSARSHFTFQSTPIIWV